MTLDWPDEASRLLKAELKRSGVTYKELVARLAEVGVNETEVSVRSKLKRGTFQFAFVMQCAYALKLEVLRLDLSYREPRKGAS